MNEKKRREENEVKEVVVMCVCNHFLTYVFLGGEVGAQKSQQNERDLSTSFSAQ